jgi:hypothetical protein
MTLYCTMYGRCGPSTCGWQLGTRTAQSNLDSLDHADILPKFSALSVVEALLQWLTGIYGFVRRAIVKRTQVLIAFLI